MRTERGPDGGLIRVLDVENVTYYRHVVRFKLKDGRRRRLVRWSPGAPFVYDEVGRELDDIYGVDAIVPRSCVVTREDRRA